MLELVTSRLRWLPAVFEALSAQHRFVSSPCGSDLSSNGASSSINGVSKSSASLSAACSSHIRRHGLHSSSAAVYAGKDIASDDARSIDHVAETTVGSTENVISRGHGAYHVNSISIDQLLQNQPLSAVTTTTISSSSSSSSSNGHQEPKNHHHHHQQQELTEQLLSELFDAELEQRLLSAAAAARRQATQTQAFTTVDDHTAASDAELDDMSAAYQDLPGFAAAQTQQQQQQQQQRDFQPGVVPTLPPAYQHPSSSSSSSSSRLARVSSWHPSSSRTAAAAAADPWAPLPGPALARRRLPDQLKQLLQQAGVPKLDAAAAVEAASAPQQQQQQQQQRKWIPPTGKHEAHHLSSSAAAAAAAAVIHHSSLFKRLRVQQLMQLLEDCQAPTYGSKDLLVNRIVLLLREQTLQQQQQQQQEGASTWLAGEGLNQQSWLESDLYGSSSNPAAASDAAAQQPLPTDSSSSKHHHHQQQQQGGSGLSQRVAAAAAARQQLLDHVLDVNEIGSWLLAARAQDVCIVDVRGRAGLHEQLIIASGLSQQHAHACAEAVTWQLKEKAKQQAQHQQQQQQSTRSSSLSDLLPSLKVLGDSSSDWAVSDAGKIVVHVLTERARRFYNLEGLWGGPGGRFIQWLDPGSVVETKDTIGRVVR